MRTPGLGRLVHDHAADDAGERIRAIDLNDLPVPEGEAGTAMRRFVRQLRLAAQREGGLSNRGQFVVLCLTLAVLLGLGFLRTRAVLPQWFSVSGFVAILAAGTAASWVVTRRVGLRIRGGGIARAIAARGYCGGCGYDLRDAAAKRPRLVECPECAARWSPDRLLSAPLGATAWDTLGKGGGRAPLSRRLAEDDRGAVIRRVRSVPWRAPRGARALWSDGHRNAMRRARRRCGFGWRIFMSLLAVSMLTGIAAIVIFSDAGASAFALGTLFVMLGIMGVGMLISAWIGEAGVSNGAFVAMVRDAGLCAACGAPLDAPVDGDGLRVCTVCGSGWKGLDSAGFGE